MPFSVMPAEGYILIDITLMIYSPG